MSGIMDDFRIEVGSGSFDVSEGLSICEVVIIVMFDATSFWNVLGTLGGYRTVKSE